MNRIVNTEIFEKSPSRYFASELCKTGETAFIGKCGCGPANSLYLITYKAVIQADTPNYKWGGAAQVIVDRFVDIEITIKEK